MIPAIRRLVRGGHRRLFRKDVINRSGRGIVNLIDVGSVGGLPAPWDKHANLLRHVLKFEPLEQPTKSGTVITVPAALWSRPEEREFYIQAGASTGDSLYPPNFEWVKDHWAEIKDRGPRELADTWLERSTIVRTERLTTTTLDVVLAGLGASVRYHVLKIDAQGADYDILVGAQRFLERDCLAIHLEGFVLPLIKGVTLLPDVDKHLDALGFERIWTAPAHGSFDSQHDVLYVRRGVTESKELATIAHVYGLPDHATNVAT